MSEIKNCPFCAHDEIVLVPSTVDDDYYNARCVRCGACGPTAFSETIAVERWNKRCEVRQFAQPNADAYEDLRNTTPEELLDAEIWFTQQSIKDPWQLKQALSFLRTGFQLAQPGGWEQVAPWWLRESKKLAALDVKE